MPPTLSCPFFSPPRSSRSLFLSRACRLRAGAGEAGVPEENQGAESSRRWADGAPACDLMFVFFFSHVAVFGILRRLECMLLMYNHGDAAAPRRPPPWPARSGGCVGGGARRHRSLFACSSVAGRSRRWWRQVPALLPLPAARDDAALLRHQLRLLYMNITFAGRRLPHIVVVVSPLLPAPAPLLRPHVVPSSNPSVAGARCCPPQYSRHFPCQIFCTSGYSAASR